MKNKRALSNKPKITTQKYLDIAEIKDGTVILKDGSLRSVLLVSSVNFALKSEDEQNAIISAYVSFLNNIDFPVQIVIQSRRLNIELYIEELKKKEKEQTNELLRIQISDYRQYIAELVKMADIMSKKFFLVVPFVPGKSKHKNFFVRIAEIFKIASVIDLEKEVFKKRRHEISKRVDHILSGLQSMGLSATPLDTQALIELYYNTFNPDVSSRQKFTNTEEIQVEDF